MEQSKGVQTVSEYEHTEHLLIQIDYLRTANRQLREYAEDAVAKIKRLEDALRRIANQDYRGNRSTESQIAAEALKEAKP